MNEYRESACVPADHPCLPGHFPGNPIVPGVMLLEALALALRRWRGPSAQVACFNNVKFVSVLRPNQTFEIFLYGDDPTLRFRCEYEGRVLCQGSLTLAATA